MHLQIRACVRPGHQPAGPCVSQGGHDWAARRVLLAPAGRLGTGLETQKPGALTGAARGLCTAVGDEPPAARVVVGGTGLRGAGVFHRERRRCVCAGVGTQ